MRRDIPLAEYDPCERAPIRVVHRQSSALSQAPGLTDLCNGLPNIILVLNEQRQIVFASKSFLELAQISDYKKLVGMRPGEALGCMHAEGSKDGCGTTAACEHCGAARAILSSLAGLKAREEFHMARLIRCGPETLDLMVQATPFFYKKERFTLFAVSDIRTEMRRQVLEKLLFQDFLSSSADLEELFEILKANAPTELKSRIEQTCHNFHLLHDEVQMQKDLALSEDHQLSVTLAPIPVSRLWEELVRVYQVLNISADHRIEWDRSGESLEVVSDQALLKRILGLLLKDALESSPVGQPVRVGCQERKGRIEFWVHSRRFIPPSIQLQLFHHRYSSKGKGVLRSAYDARFLAERYLRGQVAYESTPEKGTTFRLSLPKQIKTGAKKKKASYGKH